MNKVVQDPAVQLVQRETVVTRDQPVHPVFKESRVLLVFVAGLVTKVPRVNRVQLAMMVLPGPVGLVVAAEMSVTMAKTVNQARMLMMDPKVLAVNPVLLVSEVKRVLLVRLELPASLVPRAMPVLLVLRVLWAPL